MGFAHHGGRRRTVDDSRRITGGERSMMSRVHRNSDDPFDFVPMGPNGDSTSKVSSARGGAADRQSTPRQRAADRAGDVFGDLVRRLFSGQRQLGVSSYRDAVHSAEARSAQRRR